MKKVLLSLIVIVVTSMTASAQNMYITSPYTDSLWTVADTSTMVATNAVQMTLPGYTVTGSNGLTIHQCSDAAYVSLKVTALTGRLIATIDLTTGVADSLILVPDNIANIDLINDSIIAIIFGDGATATESLGFVNVNDSTFTALGPTSGAGSDGESMAFCPDNGKLYRWSGRNTDPAMESYDPLAPAPVTITRTGHNYDEVFGSTYVGNGNFLLANLDQEFILVDTSGFAILLPQTTTYFGYAKGVAFAGPSINFLAANSDTICTYGDSTWLGASDADAYQWYLEGAIIPGATDTTYLAGTAGTYTCEITKGSCTSIAAQTLVVSNHPIIDTAVVTPASPVEFCFGDSVLLTGSMVSDSSEWWMMGAIVSVDTFYMVNTGSAGMYEYRLFSGANGCYDRTIVDIIENPLPTVVANADQPSYCDGDMITLTGSGTDSYVWDNSVVDGVAFSQPVGSPIMYHVVGTDALTGCMNMDSIPVNVFPNPTASGTSTDEILGTDGTIDGTFTGAPVLTFDWDNDGTGDFDDPEDLTGLTAGTYTVVVMDGNGCAATTTVIVGSQVGLNEFGMNATMSIYPNPNNGIFTVELTDMVSESLTLQVINVTGQIVFEADASSKLVDVNISEFGNGTYTLRITDGTHNATEQIIVGH
jgi:hypothetical protein